VLDNFSGVIEAKNIYPSIVTVTRPLLMAVEYNEITFRNCPLEVDLFPWVFRVHTLEILDECVLSVTDFRIVLNVDIANVFFDGFAGPALIEHQVIECLRIPFVLL